MVLGMQKNSSQQWPFLMTHLQKNNILPTVHNVTNLFSFKARNGINKKAIIKHAAAPTIQHTNMIIRSHWLSANHAAFSCCADCAGGWEGRSCCEVGRRMYPARREKGFIRWRNEGCAVERSGSWERLDQPILLREARKADSFGADIPKSKRRCWRISNMFQG